MRQQGGENRVQRAILFGALLVALIIGVLAGGITPATAQSPGWQIDRSTPGGRMLDEYFRSQAAAVTDDCLTDIKTVEDWNQKKGQYRAELLEMLGLSPFPERTPLQPEITQRIDHGDFTVEAVHFQSRPGLYVTGNLYVPKKVDKPLPAILYVCGHGRVVKDGISYGNKAHYQHHGGWFARNGYVCLTIDTLQLGEIEGLHHGTHHLGMWWWSGRGYTPAGVEAWNCIRALDYLQSRPEVDPERLGVTGRSGGGAYSWWIAAIDERIKAAVPVAGITSMHNHVVDGCVEGHCDCMYMVNTYGWNFEKVAALVAPRPLLISNTDKDRIFPLDGVVDVYNKTRRIYELVGATDHIGLQISEGPHHDTQELRVAAFHWFNRFLKNENPLIETTAVKFFKPEELKVFEELPADEKNTTIQEDFTVLADRDWLPSSPSEWNEHADRVRSDLLAKSFRAWPSGTAEAGPQIEKAFDVERGGVRFSAYDFISQKPFELRLFVAHRAGLKPADLELVVLNVLDQQGWNDFQQLYSVEFAQELGATGEATAATKEEFAAERKMYQSHPWAMAFVAARGVGLTEWGGDEKKQTQIRRRFLLLGQTLDGMRVWDVRRATQALRAVDGFKDVPLWMQGKGDAAGIALYAAMFEPDVQRVDLWDLPTTHDKGPVFLNVRRILDMPLAVALAGERSQVRLYQSNGSVEWEVPQAIAKRLNWPENRIQVRNLNAK